MKMYTLIGTDGKPYQSEQKGTFGGNKQGRIYGGFDCSSANNAIAKGNYAQHRVFFADELTAMLAGYRPCGTCMKERFPLWKQALDQAGGDRKRALEIYRSLCGY